MFTHVMPGPKPWGTRLILLNYLDEKIRNCPSLEVDDGDYFRTYGMYRSSLVDSWYNNKKEEWGNFAVRNGSEDSLYYAIGRMRTPTKIFMFADTMCTAESTYSGKGLWTYSPTWNGSGNDSSGISIHHAGRCNMSFFDGHAASQAKADLKVLGFTSVIDGGSRVGL